MQVIVEVKKDMKKETVSYGGSFDKSFFARFQHLKKRKSNSISDYLSRCCTKMHMLYIGPKSNPRT